MFSLFPMGFPMVFQWFSQVVLHFFTISYGFSQVFLHFSPFPMIFPWFSHGFHGLPIASPPRCQPPGAPGETAPRARLDPGPRGAAWGPWRDARSLGRAVTDDEGSLIFADTALSSLSYLYVYIYIHICI